MANLQKRICRGTSPVDFECRVRTPNSERIMMVTAATPGLATRMAEEILPGATVIRVTKHWDPVGKCTVCGAILFKHDGHCLQRGAPVCFDCS